MRLQDVLKEREQEIAHLEISLKEKEAVASLTSNLQATTSPHLTDNMDSPSTFLSPRTINQFDEIDYLSSTFSCCSQGDGSKGIAAPRVY